MTTEICYFFSELHFTVTVMASEPQPVAEEARPTRLSGLLPKPQVQHRMTFTFCLIKEPYDEI